jgi:hypothetical protein
LGFGKPYLIPFTPNSGIGEGIAPQMELKILGGVWATIFIMPLVNIHHTLILMANFCKSVIT